MIDPLAFVASFAVTSALLALAVAISRLRERVGDLERLDHDHEPAPVRPLNPTTGARVPELTWDPADVIAGDGLGLQVGYAGLLWDGEPFPFVTVDRVAISVSDDELIVATVQIPVRLPAGIPAVMPAADGKAQ